MRRISELQKGNRKHSDDIKQRLSCSLLQYPNPSEVRNVGLLKLIGTVRG